MNSFADNGIRKYVYYFAKNGPDYSGPSVLFIQLPAPEL